jgi:hypothetical protein
MRTALLALASAALLSAVSAMGLRPMTPGPLPLSEKAGRDSLVATGQVLYNDRAHETYSEGTDLSNHSIFF